MWERLHMLLLCMDYVCIGPYVMPYVWTLYNVWTMLDDWWSICMDYVWCWMCWTMLDVECVGPYVCMDVEWMCMSMWSFVMWNSVCSCILSCILCIMCYVYAQFIIFGEPRSSASIEHTPRVGTSAFSQLTPTPGTYWNPLPRSDEVPKLGIP